MILVLLVGTIWLRRVAVWYHGLYTTHTATSTQTATTQTTQRAIRMSSDRLQLAESQQGYGRLIFFMPDDTVQPRAPSKSVETR